MATYLMFGDYSTASVKAISRARTKKADALIEEHGGKLLSGYAMLGKHDLLLIVEMPSNEAAMKLSVALSKLLDIAFTTAPAVTIEAFDKLFS